MRFAVTMTLALAAAGCNEAAAPADATKSDPEPAEAADGKTPPAEDPTTPAADGDGKGNDEGEVRSWTFDDEAAATPAGFRLTETAGQGTPATWAIVEREDAPSAPKVFGITETRNDKRTFNVALVEGTSYGDVDIAVMVHARTGELDQGGGPIWRAKDADNYYLARWNPLENNVRFYVVLSGHRSTLAKADVELDPAQWHELRVVAEGTRLQCFLDDEPVMNIEDTSLTEPGMIGLWTKADAATLFDDLSARAL